MSMREKRVTYTEIKAEVLEAYFEGCRDLGLCEGRPQTEIMGYVIYQFENAYEKTLENFMLCVVQLVLSGGWHTDAESHARNWIANQLGEHELDIFLIDVPKDEVDIFRYDLQLLKLI